MTMQQTSAAHVQALAMIHADPLALVPDMLGSWLNFGKEGLPFDKGVAPLLEAHKRDGGGIDDIDVPDIRQLPVGPGMDGKTLVIGRPSTGESFKIRRTAWAGLASRLRLGEGVNDLLFRRMPPQLQVATINTIMRRENEKIPATLRVRNGEILAVVSDRYAAIDTPDMVDMVRGALKADGLLESAMVTGVSWGGRDLVRVNFPGMSKELKSNRQVGDIVSRGLDFRNGSWGSSSVSLMTNTMRLVCLNGMTRDEKGSAWHFRHVGTRDKIQGKVKDAIPLAVRESGEMVDRFEMALGMEIASLGALFNPLKDEMLVSEQDMLRTHLKREMQVPVLEPKNAVPLFDAVNALTAMAQELSTERRIHVESLAGGLLYKSTQRAA